MASETDDDWQRVGKAVNDRFVALRLTKAELIERSGVSFKTLSGYLEGEPIRRVDKRRDLARALGWTIDSIDRSLDGLPPIDQDALDAVHQERAWVDHHLAELLRIDPDDRTADDKASIEHWSLMRGASEHRLSNLENPERGKVEHDITGEWLYLSRELDKIKPVEERRRLIHEWRAQVDTLLITDDELALAAEGEPTSPAKAKRARRPSPPENE